jgi:hypothetical protein
MSHEIMKVELIGEDKIVKLCPFCGWPEDDVFTEASRHRTSVGQTVWTRCVCGSLQMRVIDAGGSRVVARSHGDRALVNQDAPCR